ncbi:MAG TPA: hypothetical protein VFT82_03265 [Candidatus Paceibacterota bacterium]|nr:hypothetical protein [Candidatus Paceibacterota bacterium]
MTSGNPPFCLGREIIEIRTYGTSHGSAPGALKALAPKLRPKRRRIGKLRIVKLPKPAYEDE